MRILWLVLLVGCGGYECERISQHIEGYDCFPEEVATCYFGDAREQVANGLTGKRLLCLESRPFGKGTGNFFWVWDGSCR